MTDKTTLKSLLYMHHKHHQHVLEGIQDPEQISKSYDWWIKHSVITAITPAYPESPKYIRIELLSKSKGLLVSRYGDREISAGLYVCISDYGTDKEQYYWCRNWLTAWVRKVLCRVKAEGPYLINTIRIKDPSQG